MNKSLTILAGASVLMVGLPLGMLSQARAASGTFADVPTDHWAYAAVDTLQKAGVVIGYPDGTYGGTRAMTRYEFAEAVARLLPLLKVDTSGFATTDQLTAAQRDLQAKIDTNSAAIAALQQLVNGFTPELTALGQDVTAVKARLDALESRVSAVEAEQARLHITGDVNIIGRASQISKGVYAIDQNGSVYSTYPSYAGDYNYFSPQDGLKTNNRVFQNDSVLNDFLLGIRGRLNDQATANVLIDFGNYIPSLGNTVTPGTQFGQTEWPAQGSFPTAQGYAENFSGGPGQTTVWEAYLATPTGYGPLGQGDLKAGRLPIQWTNYTLKSNDADLYTTLYQTTSGNIPVDGASADLHTGPVSWNAWAGKFNAIGYAQPYAGAALQGLNYGEYSSVAHAAPRANANYASYFYDYQSQLLGAGLDGYTDAEPIDQGVGLRGTLGGGTSKLGVSVAQYALDFAIPDPERVQATYNGFTDGKMYNRVTVYGADYTGTIPYIKEYGLGLDASYNVAAFGNGSGFNNVESGWRNSETDDQLTLKFGPVALKGGYRYIGPDYSAPGYWGNIGSWSNPTNIEGPVASAKIKFLKTTGIDLGYADYDGAYKSTEGGLLYETPILKGDELTQYTVGTGYALGHRDVVHIGYEYDDYNLKAAYSVSNGVADGSQIYSYGGSGHPDQSFLTLGLNHTINTNATFKLTYQYYTYNDNNTGYVYNNLYNNAYTTNSEGSTVVGQFSLKF